MDDKIMEMIEENVRMRTALLLLKRKAQATYVMNHTDAEEILLVAGMSEEMPEKTVEELDAEVLGSD